MALLYPHLGGLDVTDIDRDNDHLVVIAATRTSEALRPACGIVTEHLHSRYQRTLTDVGPALSAMRIHLTVRRFRYANDACEQATFAEQVDGLTGRYRRTTPAAQEVIDRLGTALAGRAGARIAGMLGIARSRHTLLRAVRALPDPEPPETTPVIGINDFAFRKRHTYGTVIVDQDGRRVLDVLPDRSAETVAAWLTGKQGIEVVCRDRAAAYGAAITAAQPDAVQVADRWHLWKNLCDAVDRSIAANRRWARLTDEPEPVPRRPEDAAPDVDRVAEGRRAQNTRRRWAQVQQLGTDQHGPLQAVDLPARSARRRRCSTPQATPGGPPRPGRPHRSRRPPSR
ncbi:ISL3 family transposase [Glycomyces sp. NPDC048151]|uniref:ISL3 family transposase n=1 Tax=Glycomyces sp. NPDC048151 TaxID=3364002 RepID=UPI003724236F